MATDYPPPVYKPDTAYPPSEQPPEYGAPYSNPAPGSYEMQPQPGSAWGYPAPQGYGAPPPQGYGAPLPQGYGAPPPQGYRQQVPLPASNTVMVTQAGPAVFVQQPTSPNKHKFLPFAIFTTICCNLPCGIVAIVFAVLADGGESTDTYNTISLVFCILALLSGFAIWGFVIYYIVAFAVVASSFG